MPAGRVAGLSREAKKALVYVFADRVNDEVRKAWRAADLAKTIPGFPRHGEGWRNVFHLVPVIDEMKVQMIRQSDSPFWTKARETAERVWTMGDRRVALVVEPGKFAAKRVRRTA